MDAALLTNYLQLLQKIDAFFSRVQGRYPEWIRCQAGCNDCCRRDLTLFSFEVERMVGFARGLPAEDRARIGARAQGYTGQEDHPCVFLEERGCLIYEARPVICRSHGIPLLVPGEASISICPLNFKGIKGLKGDCVLDLSPVNAILSALAHQAAGQTPNGSERVRVVDAVLGTFDAVGG